MYEAGDRASKARRGVNLGPTTKSLSTIGYHFSFGFPFYLWKFFFKKHNNGDVKARKKALIILNSFDREGTEGLFCFHLIYKNGTFILLLSLPFTTIIIVKRCSVLYRLQWDLSSSIESSPLHPPSPLSGSSLCCKCLLGVNSFGSWR